MDSTQIRVAGTGLLFLLMSLSGFWLSHSGRPLSTGILTIHKLIGLAGLVFFVVIVYQTNQGEKLSSLEFTLAAFTVLVFLATIIVGGLLSTNKTMPAFVLRLHQLLPVLTTLSAAVALFLLLGEK